LTKLVASRESERIRDGENERDNYNILLAMFLNPNPNPAMPHCSTRLSKPQSQPHPQIKTKPQKTKKLTNKRQPNKLQTRQRHDRQKHPQHRLRIQRNPKEALIRRIDLPHLRIRALKHPSAVPRARIHLVPPAQADEPPPRDVLEVVEVGGQEQDGDYEDEDEVGGEEAEAEEVD
jgi:hypothetical protein